MTAAADAFFAIFGIHRVEYEAEVRGILRGGTVENGRFVYRDGNGRQEIPVERVEKLRKLEGGKGCISKSRI